MRTGTLLLDVLLVLTMCVPMAQADPPPPCPPLPLGEAINRDPSHPVTLSLGVSLSGEGDLLLAGSSQDRGPNGEQSVGAILAYSRDGETWRFDQRISIDTLPANSGFGRFVEMSGDLLVTSTSSNAPLTPSLQVFRREGGMWVFDSAIQPLRGGVSDLDIENGVLAYITQTNEGMFVDIYERPTGTWEIVGTIAIAPEDSVLSPVLELSAGRVFLVAGRSGAYALRIYERGPSGYAQFEAIPVPISQTFPLVQLAAFGDMVVARYPTVPVGSPFARARVLIAERVGNDWLVQHPSGVFFGSTSRPVAIATNGTTVAVGDITNPYAAIFNKDTSGEWRPNGLLDRGSLALIEFDSLGFTSPNPPQMHFIGERLLVSFAGANIEGGTTGAVFAFPPTFNDRLTFLATPVVTATALGAPATVSASIRASSTPLTIQWFKDGMPLVDDGVVGGTSTATLTIASLRTEDRGLYTCRISDGCDMRDSPPAFLEVPCALVVGLPPKVQARGGEPFEISVEVSGLEPIVYEWRRNGVLLTSSGRISADSRTLLINPLLLEDQGTYTFTASCAQQRSSTTTTVLTIPSCAGDADGSGIVDFYDIEIVLAVFGMSTTVPFTGDANRDGVVTFLDITSVLSNFGNTCE